MPYRNPIVAGLTLIRQAIKSPDFASGLAGWSINKDGSAEFNNATVRGEFEAGGGVVRVDSTGLYITVGAVTVQVTIAGMTIQNATTKVETIGTGVEITDLDTGAVCFLDALGLYSNDPVSELSTSISQGFISCVDSFNMITTNIGPANMQMGAVPVMVGQRGTATLTAAAANSATKAVVFPYPFDAEDPTNPVPNVTLNIRATPGAAGAIPRLWNLRAISTTQVGFTIVGYSVDASVATFTNQIVEWTAHGGYM